METVPDSRSQKATFAGRGFSDFRRSALHSRRNIGQSLSRCVFWRSTNPQRKQLDAHGSIIFQGGSPLPEVRKRGNARSPTSRRRAPRRPRVPATEYTAWPRKRYFASNGGTAMGSACNRSRATANWRSFGIGQDRDVRIAAKFRFAVKNARLAPRQQVQNAALVQFRKDFENRVRGQASLPFARRNPRLSRFPASAPRRKAYHSSHSSSAAGCRSDFNLACVGHIRIIHGSARRKESKCPESP